MGPPRPHARRRDGTFDALHAYSTPQLHARRRSCTLDAAAARSRRS
ncbi:hypothetical protein I546_5321 [Mycobacterium kansasii 732]|nr:hypothetical protein I546_5321 [Mycobacterium kansasii 732]